jgi:PAS domain S-box-containing protein
VCQPKEAAIDTSIDPGPLQADVGLSVDACAILESMADSFFAVDSGWHIVYANRRALAFWGLTGQAVLGQTIWQTLPQLSGTKNENTLREAMSAQRRVCFNAPSPVTGAWVQVNVVPRGNGLAVYWRDISAHRLSEQTMRDSEEHLRLAQEAAGIATWEYDLVTHRIRWSPQMYRLLGHDPGAISPRCNRTLWLRALYPADRAWLRSAARRCAQEIAPFTISFRIIRSDGAVRWISCRGNVLPDEFGRPARMLGVNIDITDAKLTEAALERRVAERTQALRDTVEELQLSRSRYGAVFDHSPVDLALLRVEPDGTVICEEANPAWTRHSGFTRKQVVGRKFTDIFTPDQATFALAQYRRAIETGEKVEYEYTTTFPAGEVTRRSFLVPLPDAEGRISHVLMTSVDLTETRRIEAQFRQAQKMEAIGQLTGGLAHDFNNLLAAVVGNLEMLENRLADPTDRQYVSAAMRAAQRGGSLTQQLLATARRQNLSPQPVDSNAVIAGMSDLLQRSLGGLVQVEQDLAPDLWHAWADPTQLELMILNLAINARDAMPDGGRIQVATRNVTVPGSSQAPELEDGDYVVVTVSDNGSGMAQAVAERAFEPFFTTKPAGKGSGLGLAQVYGLARQFGGTAHLHSVVGHGTGVEVFLPYAVREAAPATTVAPVRPARPPPGAAVLVVDDDDDVRDLAASFLRDAGYTVIEAASGPDALERLRKAPVAVMLADYAMPEMSGTELVRHAREINPSVAVVYVTGNADPLDAEAATGNDLVLTKPYRSAVLLAAVAQAVAPAG